LLDFGLSISYLKSDGTHVDFNEGCKRCGTARYSSLNCHRRYKQSRRDDLEALGYVLLLFIRDLPWKQHKGENPDRKWSRIYDEKQKWTIKKLCEEANLPIVFTRYFEHVRSLEFLSTPNYELLLNLFDDTMQENNYKMDKEYDWCPIFGNNSYNKRKR